jgi:oligopeptide/dipeptide ABC transporter ATP-binding protein
LLARRRGDGVTAPVLEVTDLVKHFPVQRGLLRRTVAHVKAVDGVSFAVARGETLCLVGESGCGKSTVSRLIVRLTAPTAGRIRIDGRDVTDLDGDALRPLRQRVQMVFQDPYASLNPRLRAGTIVGEPIENFERLDGAARQDRVASLFAKVGLRADAMNRFPFEFSGGQRQRLGIARALAVNPALIVADEPVSALDVSVQAQVLNLLMDLQREFGLAYLFVSHDLGVVEHIGHRVAVMYLGKIVEIADKASIFRAPKHPYARALIEAAPVPNPRARRDRLVLEGDVPSALDRPTGCAFHTRCPFVTDRCRMEEPPLVREVDGHMVACHLHPAA